MPQNRNKPNIAVEVYNPQTGEKFDNVHVSFGRRSKVTDWMMVFHRGTELMAKDPEITGQAYRVFMYAISHLAYENKVKECKSDIARALNMKQPRVSEAFRLLVSKGIFVEGPKYGSSKTYYLSTDYGWKGSVKLLKERAKNELEQQKDENPPQTARTAHKPNLEEPAA